MRSKFTPFAGCLIAIAITATGGRTSAQGPDTVPAYLLPAIQRPLIEFVMLLTNASIPVGIEVKESDDRPPRRPPVRDSTDTKRVTKAELVAAFNAQKPAYHAEWIGDVLAIRPVEGRAMFLDRPSPITSPMTAVGLSVALDTIFSPLNARLLEPRVGALSGKEALRGWTTTFTLDGNGRTVADTLNDLAVQQTGAWWVTTRLRDHEWHVAKFGFVYADFAYSITPMPAT